MKKLGAYCVSSERHKQRIMSNIVRRFTAVGIGIEPPIDQHQGLNDDFFLPFLCFVLNHSRQLDTVRIGECRWLVATIRNTAPVLT